jgi:hypothetical protein
MAETTKKFGEWLEFATHSDIVGHTRSAHVASAQRAGIGMINSSRLGGRRSNPCGLPPRLFVPLLK